MLVVEGQGLPIGVLVERSDLAEATLAAVKVPRRVGRSKIRPKEVRATSDTLRRKLRARGGKPCIPRSQMREEAGSQWLQGEMEGGENLCLAF